MSFLKVFASILHATEAAASIAAPIVATMDPTIGGLMSAATTAAVGAEAAITAPGSGPQKAAAVQAQTQASIGVINAILASQNKKPLPANTGDVIASQVGVVVGNLNAIKAAVLAAPAGDTGVVDPALASRAAAAPAGGWAKAARSQLGE